MGNGASAVARKKQAAAAAAAAKLKAGAQNAKADALAGARQTTAFRLATSFPAFAVALAFGVFAALAAWPSTFGFLESEGLRFLRALQAVHTPVLDIVCQILSYMGFELYFALVIVWSFGRLSTFRMGVSYLRLILYTFYLISLAKSYYERSRPLMHLITTTTTRPRAADELEFSFPSGHSTGAVVTCLYLCKLGFVPRSPRGLVAIVAAIVTLSVSRLYLGVHYPHDVVGGWVLGLAIVLLYDWSEGDSIGQPPPGEGFAWRLVWSVVQGVGLTALPMATLSMPVLREHGGLAFAAGGIAGIGVGEALRHLGFLSEGAELPWKGQGRILREVLRRLFVLSVALLFIAYCELSLALAHPISRAAYGAILCWFVTFVSPGLLYCAPIRAALAAAAEMAAAEKAEKAESKKAK